MNERISSESEQEWADRREARFAALERLLEGRPSFPESEVEADIAEAMAAVRSRRAANRVEGE